MVRNPLAARSGSGPFRANLTTSSYFKSQILTRVDAIRKKYDRYDFDKQKHLNLSAAADAFARLYAAVDSDIAAALQDSLKKFFFLGPLRLLSTPRFDAPKLEELAARNDLVLALPDRIQAIPDGTAAAPKQSGGWTGLAPAQKSSLIQVKGLSTEELAARNDLVLALPDRIQAIPDGTAAAPKQSGGWTGSASHTEIKFDSGLEVISEGLDALKNMAHDLNEVDKVASDLKNTNVRLKDTVNQLRSSRNFCIDIILLCIILGIAAYLYNLFYVSWCVEGPNASIGEMDTAIVYLEMMEITMSKEQHKQCRTRRNSW
ncbi:hypothetical protein TEA_006675 [Camellia sinensis var. sinensis]|uniref:t-SNARE coiled-coil homology domain-containing protein n=1 Tax=Camellia sinensis var. sinensis TaxID=542762 RepID=A0A4S4DVI0_CAMSN|nr:hypothetical protein TEA_006675 [Camellia sinensis var. sinensis]